MSQIVSHYCLEDEIGRGAMGVVYRATDTRLGALAKWIAPGDATADADRTARFVRETQAASALGAAHATGIVHRDHAVLEGGHAPARHCGLIREVLDWLDKYLGPVG